MKPLSILTAISALALSLAASAQGPLRPDANSDRPGGDKQSNIGSTVNNPPFANAPNAERTPPEAPPGWRDPRVTQDEIKNVNPQHGRYPAGDNAVNRSEANERPAGSSAAIDGGVNAPSSPTSPQVAPTPPANERGGEQQGPQPGSKAWREQRD